MWLSLLYGQQSAKNEINAKINFNLELVSTNVMHRFKLNVNFVHPL